MSKYHFIGVKGSGMSALACILADLGHEVTGSDIKNPVFTEEALAKRNIVAKDFDINNVLDVDLIIIGNAFNESNIEVEYTFNNNLKYLRYFDFINEFGKEYNSVAIAGTNGKTTTTSLTTQMFCDQNIISLVGDGNGFANKDAEMFIYEACEYKETFLNYHPDILVINNIEMDHPDFFKDVNHVIEVFQKFANQAKTVIVNGDDENCQAIKHDNLYSFGLSDNCDLIFKDLVQTTSGYEFEVIFKNNSLGKHSLNFVGMHMVYNAMASLLVGLIKGDDINTLINNLNMFKGAKRRFETSVINEQLDVVLIDDYAHHPTAIDLVIAAIRQKYPQHELTVLFQPHTYSRTIEFLDEFAQSLCATDNLYLAEIFGSAREASGEINIDVLKQKVRELNMHVFDDLSFIDGNKPNQVIAILGAGDIDQLYKQKIIDTFRR